VALIEEYRLGVLDSRHPLVGVQRLEAAFQRLCDVAVGSIYALGQSEGGGQGVPSTKTVTILFTDMVGSTELSQRLDPKAADELRQRHFSLLCQALAASEGQEVKNLGDGIMAVFSSPSAAVVCSVAMQQAVERDNRRSVNPVGLRVAMSGGEVTTEDDDYFGDPVVEAARLCAVCRGGQILTTDTVRGMAGRRSPHSFVSLGGRGLKGITEPVVVCEVQWEPSSHPDPGIPLPDHLADTETSALFGFFGRQRERALLDDTLKNTTAAGHHVAFV